VVKGASEIAATFEECPIQVAEVIAKRDRQASKMVSPCKWLNRASIWFVRQPVYQP
jgi:hypothetical protein